VVLLVIVAAAGVVLARQDRRDVLADSDPGGSTGVDDRDEPVAVAPNRPSNDAAGIPAGFSADEPGAVAAAVAYATASQRWLYLSDGQIAAAVTAIATTDAAPVLTDEVIANVSMARDQLAGSSGPVWWLVRPLAWRIEGFHTSGARVSVWTMSILSAAGVAAPQSEFSTVTLDLVWADGDWRVDAVRDTAGPTPVTGPKDQPWEAEPFDERLDGFTRIDAEPGS
jgi:hypothetical protein